MADEWGLYRRADRVITLLPNRLVTVDRYRMFSQGPPIVDDCERCMNPRVLRRRFRWSLIAGLRVVWPILSGLLGLILALGMTVGRLEGWSMLESFYFSF